MRLVKTSLNKLSCHPAAMDAFVFSQNQQKQYRPKCIPKEFLSYIRANCIPKVVEYRQRHFQYISGWGGLIDQNDNTISVIKINEELSEDEINKRAWSYVFFNQINSWNRKSFLNSLSSCFEKMPHDWLSLIKAHNNKNSKSSLLMNLTGESRSAVRHQINVNAGSLTPTAQSIFEELING